MTDAPQQDRPTKQVNRRGFVGAAAVGVGAVWVAPAVISTPAGAQSALVNSPPPTTTTTSTPTTSSTTSTTSTTRPTTTSTTEPDSGQLPNDGNQGFPGDGGVDDGGANNGGNLPRTGFDLHDPLTAAFGLIAAGGAAKVWSTRRALVQEAEAVAQASGGTTGSLPDPA